MKKVFEKISNLLEIDNSTSEFSQLNPDEQRRIKLVNYIGLISTLNMLVYMLIYIFIDFFLFKPAIYFLMFTSLINLVVIWINKLGKHKLAKYLTAGLNPFYMLYISEVAFGKEPGFQMYLLLAAIIPLFLWNLKYNIYATVIVGVIVGIYILTEFSSSFFEPKILLPENYIYTFRKTNIIACFMGAGLALVILQQLYRKTEEQLIVQTNKLRISQEHKDKIYSIIAHDLKGPVGSFAGLTELFVSRSESCSEDEKYNLIRSMHQTSISLLNLLENLLDWSRMQTGNRKVSLMNIKLLKVVNDSVVLHEELIQKKKQKINVSIDSKIKVHADKHMVSTIFRNLISNATKFTGKNGIISIFAVEEGSMIKICVEDSGIGMTKKDISYLFDITKFNKVTPKSKEKGSGLGLLLCSDFVKENDGKLWIESKIGKGSKFWFTLPKAVKKETPKNNKISQ